MAPIVRKPAFRKSFRRYRQASYLSFRQRHARLVMLTVISSNEQGSKQPTYAVAQGHIESMAPQGKREKRFCSSWAMTDTQTDRI